MDASESVSFCAFSFTESYQELLRFDISAGAGYQTMTCSLRLVTPLNRLAQSLMQ